VGGEIVKKKKKAGTRGTPRKTLETSTWERTNHTAKGKARNGGARRWEKGQQRKGTLGEKKERERTKVS